MLIWYKIKILNIEDGYVDSWILYNIFQSMLSKGFIVKISLEKLNEVYNYCHFTLYIIYNSIFSYFNRVLSSFQSRKMKKYHKYIF